MGGISASKAHCVWERKGGRAWWEGSRAIVWRVRRDSRARSSARSGRAGGRGSGGIRCAGRLRWPEAEEAARGRQAGRARRINGDARGRRRGFSVGTRQAAATAPILIGGRWSRGALVVRGDARVACGGMRGPWPGRAWRGQGCASANAFRQPAVAVARVGLAGMGKVRLAISSPLWQAKRHSVSSASYLGIIASDLLPSLCPARAWVMICRLPVLARTICRLPGLALPMSTYRPR